MFTFIYHLCFLCETFTSNIEHYLTLISNIEKIINPTHHGLSVEIQLGLLASGGWGSVESQTFLKKTKQDVFTEAVGFIFEV